MNHFIKRIPLLYKAMKITFSECKCSLFPYKNYDIIYVGEFMKVISLLEPWASLIKEKVKHIETRSWKTNYRGELYIHASKRKLTKNNYIDYKEQLGLLNDIDFKYGYIIAKCKLVDCKLMTDELIKEVKQNHSEYISGVYKVGRYAWILENIEMLEVPIHANGQLGIWNYEENDYYELHCDKFAEIFMK